MYGYETDFTLPLFGLERKELHPDDIALMTDLYGPPSDGLPPDRPELASPSRFTPTGTTSAVVGASQNLHTFQWKVSANATNYIFQVSDTPGFENLIYSTSTADTYVEMTEVASASSLNLLQKYYWRVKAGNSDGNSDWSFPWELRLSRQSCVSDIGELDDDPTAPEILEFWRRKYDANCDGQLSLADLETCWLQYQGKISTPMIDYDGNGTVDTLDWLTCSSVHLSWNYPFDTEPLWLTQPVRAYFENSLQLGQDSDPVQATIYFETDPKASVTVARIRIQYPADLLEFAKFEPCDNGNKLDQVWIKDAKSGSKSVTILHQVTRSDGDDPSGSFCFGTAVFKQTESFVYPKSATISFDTDSGPWDIVGAQTSFRLELDSVRSTVRIHKGPVVFLPSVSATR